MAEQCINAGVQGLHNLLQSWLDALIWILTSDKREDGFSLVPSIISPILCTYIVIRQQWAKNNTQHQNPCFKIKKKKKKKINNQIFSSCFKWNMNSSMILPYQTTVTPNPPPLHVFLLVSHHQATEQGQQPCCFFFWVEAFSGEIHISVSLYLFKAPLIVTNSEWHKRNHFCRFNQNIRSYKTVLERSNSKRS